VGYWNRDLSDPKREDAEAFRCWHDDCFPAYCPTTAEKFMGEGMTNDDYAVHVFGGGSLGSPELGVEHMIELAMADSYYADAIERYLTDSHRWTPDGYAWANWRMGANCETCGKPC
jgi:hypothetical protein